MINHNGKEYGKECMYMHNRVTLLYSRSEYNIVSQLHFNKFFLNVIEEYFFTWKVFKVYISVAAVTITLLF